MKYKAILGAGFVSTLLTSVAYTPAFAQAAAGAQLEEIVVTAQRREEQNQTVPIAITAITAETLKSAGVQTTLDVSRVTPGFLVTQQIGAILPSIRAVGAQSAGVSDEASVPTYVDGFYLTDGQGNLFELNNIQQVEVLKGPQGTLFGRNAMGGLVHIITRTPQSRPLLEASVGYGSQETFTGSLYVTGGLFPNVAADLSVTVREQGQGFGTNLTTGHDALETDSSAIRGKLVYAPREGFKQTFGADWSRYDSSFGVMRRPSVGAFGAGGRQRLPGQDFYDVTANLDSLARYDMWGVNSTTELAAPWFDLVGKLQYREGQGDTTLDQDGTPLGQTDIQLGGYTYYSTAELQFVSNATSPFEWIVGLFRFDSRSGANPISLRSALAPTSTAANRDTYSKVTTASNAIYGQATFDLGTKFRLTVGARYTSDDKSMTAAAYSTTGALLGVYPTSLNHKPWAEATYRVALDYRFTDAIMGYASYSTGFKSGTYIPTGITTGPVNPEHIDASEIGLKVELFDHRLRLNSAAYYYKWKDIQLTRVVPGSNALSNAALAEGYGADFEAELVVTEALQIRSSVALLHTEFKSFPNGVCFRGPNPAGGDISEPLPPAGVAVGVAGSCDLAGNRLPRSPELTAYLGADYTIPSSVGEFKLTASYYYNDGFFWESENRMRQPGYGLLNAQAAWEAPSERWSVQLWGNNLTEEKYDLYGAASAAFGDQVSAAPGRSFGVRLGVKLQADEPVPPPPPPAPPPPPPPPAPPPPPPPPPVAYEAKEFIVYFPFDQYVLTPEAQSVISQAADYAKAGNATRIVVVGHTDTSGSAAYNVRLSERRAKATADALVGAGVNQTALAVDWKGETMPAVATGDGVKEPLNRRATIDINF